MSKLRYKYWTREDFVDHFMRQRADHPVDPEEIQMVCMDPRWDPEAEFNGCNFVQDDLHPFWPCFRHDYDWIVNGGGIEYDRTFRENLIKFGMNRLRAWAFFFGVRLGWNFYYKWIK